MKQLLLHIGMPKTGTTSIQGFLFNSIGSDLLAGIDYHLPYPKLKNSQHLLWGLFRPVEEMSRYPQFEIERLGGIAEVAEKLEDCFSALENSNRAIISSEYFPMWTEEELVAFKTKVADLGFEKIHVLIYFRNPIDWYLSMVQQTVKADSKFYSPANFRVRYSKIIAKFTQIFGAVEIREFNRNTLVEGCAVQDFLSVTERVFEIELDKQSVVVERENISLSAEGMILLQQWNMNRSSSGKITASSARLNSLLAKSREVISQTPPKLSASVRSLITDRCAKDAESLLAYRFEFAKPESAESTHEYDSGADYSDVRSILQRYDSDVLGQLESYIDDNLKLG